VDNDPMGQALKDLRKAMYKLEFEGDEKHEAMDEAMPSPKVEVKSMPLEEAPSDIKKMVRGFFRGAEKAAPKMNGIVTRMRSQSGAAKEKAPEAPKKRRRRRVAEQKPKGY
jgi:hypothetical protein